MLGIRLRENWEIVRLLMLRYLIISKVHMNILRMNRKMLLLRINIFTIKNILHINDFDLDRYITLDESQKRELRDQLVEIINQCGIVNLKELKAFLDWRGQEFGISNQRDVTDVIGSNGNLFAWLLMVITRMVFAHNMQEE